MGIPVLLLDSVEIEIDDEGEELTSIPNEKGLEASVAIARVLHPRKLAGAEIKFLRKAMGMTGREFAATMEIDPATASRWENDGQVLGGASEKMLRHLVVTELADKAPGIDASHDDIVRMRITVARDAEKAEEVQPLVLRLVKVKDVMGPQWSDAA